MKWKSEGTVQNVNKGKSGRNSTKRTTENIDLVKSLISTNDMNSTRKLAAETNISRSSIIRILKKDLKMKSFKSTVSQMLSENDLIKRDDFCKKMKSMIDSEEIDLQKIIFSDESHIYLNGVPNRQNLRKWSPTKPDFNVSKPLHSPRVTIWCGLSGTKIFGPFFYEDRETGEAVTVNSERYLAMLQEIFNDGNEHDHWFQQDGALAHTSREVMEFLNSQFPGKLISHRSVFPWPARSPDLSPLDFFLWGYVKDVVFRSNPTNVAELKEKVEEAIMAVHPETLQRVIQNFHCRLSKCIAANGGCFGG